MNSDVSTRFSTVARAVPPAPPVASADFGRRLTDLYRLSERSRHVFGSPIGPFRRHSLAYSVPRFVYFGPHTSDESLRMAFYAGFDSEDLRGTFGLLQLVERLAIEPEAGQGLNLSFFPLVDVLGLGRVW